MFRRRPTSPVSFDEIPSADYDIDGAYASDDALGESERAAKKRRIEKLAESCLQGKPVFILSASLRGPFEGSWRNPWRKHRGGQPLSTERPRKVRLQGQLQEEIAPIEVKKRKIKGNIGGVSAVAASDHSKVRGNGKSPDMLSQRRSSALKIPQLSKENDDALACSSSSRPQKQRKLLPRSTPAMTSLSQTNVSLRDSDTSENTWLKKDKRTIDMNDPQPSNSPSPAERSRHDSIEKSSFANLKLRMITLESKLGLAATDKEETKEDFQHPKDYLHGRAEKFSSPKPDMHATSIEVSRSQQSHLGLGGQSCSLSNIAVQGDNDHPEPLAMDQSAIAVQPSSCLPIEEFRLRSSTSRGNLDGDLPSNARNEGEIIRRADSEHSEISMKSVPADRNKAFSPDRLSLVDLPLSSDENRRAVSTSVTVGKSSTEKFCESEELENIPSAQPLPENMVISERFTSLHSTEPRNVPFGPFERTEMGDGEQFTTQTALLLRPQSFQADITTVGQDDPQRLVTNEHDAAFFSKGITPFYKVNACTRSDRGRLLYDQAQSAPALIDTHELTTKNTACGKKPKRATFATSSSEPLSASVARDERIMQKSPLPSPVDVKDVEKAEVEAPDNGNVGNEKAPQTSFAALPLTLSGPTPATEPQDGQGVELVVDSFDVNQVIKDVGSWLQSWDVEKDLKRCSGKSASSTQTYMPAMSLES